MLTQKEKEEGQGAKPTAMTEKNQFQIIFMPSGKRGRFKEGTTILEASRNLGVDLDGVRRSSNLWKVPNRTH